MAFEFVPQVSGPQKLLFGVLGLALLVGGGYFLLLGPKSAEVETLRGQRASRQLEVMQSRAVEVGLGRFKSEALALRARLEAARSRLPSEKEIPGLYRQISDAAFQSGLSLTLFQPKEPSAKELYQEVPITLAAEAGFHQLGTFFDRLSRLPRVVNLTDFKLTAITRPTGSLRAEATLATYVFRPDGTREPPPPPRAKP